MSVYAEAPGARSIRLADDGILFISTRRTGVVYAAVDADGDGLSAEKVMTIASGMEQPNGIALADGDLYIADVGRVLRFDDIGTKLDDPGDPVVIVDDLPTEQSHAQRYLDIGPDGRLYESIGSPCNVCLRPEPFGTIISMKLDGSDRRVEARGIRNSVGFDWQPATGVLWFTDNGRDRLGDDIPPDELNRILKPGSHYGFPYIHAGYIPDPEFGEGHDPKDYVAPAQKLGPHVAPLGIEFYEGDSFPDEYHNQILIAEHGSWNRSKKIGYRISLVRLDDDGNPASYETFIDGWMQNEEAWGRPVDLEVMPDGSLLISDDKAGLVYRVSYSPKN